MDDSLQEILDQGFNPEWDGTLEITHSWIDDFLNELEEAQDIQTK